MKCVPSSVSETAQTPPNGLLCWKTKGDLAQDIIERKKRESIEYKTEETSKTLYDIDNTDKVDNVKERERDKRLFSSMCPAVLKAQGPRVVTTYIEENYDELISIIKKTGKVKDYACTEMLNDIWYSWYRKENFGAGYIDSSEESSEDGEIDPSRVVYKYIDLYAKNGLYSANIDDLVERMPGGIEVYHIREDENEEGSYDSEGQLFNSVSIRREIDENPLNILLEEDNLEDAMLEVIQKTAHCQIPGAMILANCDALIEATTVDFDKDNLVTDKFLILVRKALFSDYEFDRGIQNDFALIFKTKTKDADLYERVYAKVLKNRTK